MSAPASAVEGVGLGVADQAVGKGVAGGVDRAGSGEDQILDITGQGEGDRGLDRVDAVGGIELHRPVERIVDDIGVVAGTTLHGVGSGAAVEDVGGAVAGDRVGEGVAGAVDRRRAGKGEVLDLGSQCEVDRTQHAVGAAACRLDCLVECVVDDIRIVAEAPGHGIGPAAAVERVGARIAG